MVCTFRIGAPLMLLFGVPLLAQREFYTGALTGISTLSGDAQSSITSSTASASSYKPENGIILNIFGGVHLNDYLSVQANYSWNRNDLTLASIRSSGLAYEQRRDSSQHSFGGDMALYFRNRRSWARPYLSVGVGTAHFKSTSAGSPQVLGAFNVPPTKFSSTDATFRTAVGIDVALTRGWAFRYSFLETMQHNPIGGQLSPPGQRRLAHFQNLFGFMKTFSRTAH